MHIRWTSAAAADLENISDYLKDHHPRFGASRDKRVIAYCALAFGVVMAENAPGRFRRNMPNPVPVAVLARLAVDQGWQGQGIGKGGEFLHGARV